MIQNMACEAALCVLIAAVGCIAFTVFVAVAYSKR